VPWQGTVPGRPVTCTTVPAPGFGRVDFVTALGLWCRGTPRHALRADVFVTDRQGTLRLDGLLCRRGPRPAIWNRKPVLWTRTHLRGCGPLAGETFASTFTPAVPPEEFDSSTLAFQPMTGQLTALHLGASCAHRIFPAVPSAIDVSVAP